MSSEPAVGHVKPTRPGIGGWTVPRPPIAGVTGLAYAGAATRIVPELPEMNGPFRPRLADRRRCGYRPQPDTPRAPSCRTRPGLPRSRPMALPRDHARAGRGSPEAALFGIATVSGSATSSHLGGLVTKIFGEVRRAPGAPGSSR
jgi:hypothetical protein